MPSALTRLIRRIAFLLVVLAGATAHAAVPETLQYQGYLTTSEGVPVNASIGMTFRLYTSAGAAVPVWTEAQPVVVSNGVYSVLLGTYANLPAAFDVPYYLGVTVSGGPELAPRQPLASAPYALTARRALQVEPGAVTAESLGITCATGQVLKYTEGSGWACGSLDCGPGTTLCGGTCIDVQGDRANCGACGAACTAGRVCSGGTCQLSCQTGLTNCVGVCVNTQSDVANCGACGMVCPSGRICSNGTCQLTCQTGLTNCSGVCTNLLADTSSCGACGSVCPAGTGCRNGTCQ